MSTTSLKRKADECEGEECRSNKKPKLFDLYKKIEEAKRILLKEHKNDIHGPINLQVLKCETIFNAPDPMIDTFIYLYNYFPETKLFDLGCVIFGFDDDDEEGQVHEFRTYDLNYFEREVRATADPVEKMHFLAYEENLRFILSSNSDIEIVENRTKHLENCIRPYIFDEGNLPIYNESTEDFICRCCLASIDIVFK